MSALNYLGPSSYERRNKLLHNLSTNENIATPYDFTAVCYVQNRATPYDFTWLYALFAIITSLPVFLSEPSLLPGSCGGIDSKEPLLTYSTLGHDRACDPKPLPDAFPLPK